MSKYLEFKLIGRKPKTVVYAVIAKHSQVRLGVIKWYFYWRQYCFFPDRNVAALKDLVLLYVKRFDKSELEKLIARLFEQWEREPLVFSAGCQDDISAFSRKLTKLQREGKIEEATL